MGNRRDITNQRFGELVALKKAPSRNGKTYWICKCNCGVIQEIKTDYLIKGFVTSCGHSKQKKEKYCLNCGQALKKQEKFCNTKCQIDFQNKLYLEDWKKGNNSGLKGNGANIKISDIVRNYLLEKANYKCEKCGWGEINPITNKIPLEIHHLDGDKTNNQEENLQILCPNCHSLTGNYKFLNSKKYKKEK